VVLVNLLSQLNVLALLLRLQSSEWYQDRASTNGNNLIDEPVRVVLHRLCGEECSRRIRLIGTHVR
jgi:hypothetical protein